MSSEPEHSDYPRKDSLQQCHTPIANDFVLVPLSFLRCLIFCAQIASGWPSRSHLRTMTFRLNGVRSDGGPIGCDVSSIHCSCRIHYLGKMATCIHFSASALSLSHLIFDNFCLSYPHYIDRTFYIIPSLSIGGFCSERLPCTFYCSS